MTNYEKLRDAYRKGHRIAYNYSVRIRFPDWRDIPRREMLAFDWKSIKAGSLNYRIGTLVPRRIRGQNRIARFKQAIQKGHDVLFTDRANAITWEIVLSENDIGRFDWDGIRKLRTWYRIRPLHKNLTYRKQKK